MRQIAYLSLVLCGLSVACGCGSKPSPVVEAEPQIRTAEVSEFRDGEIETGEPSTNKSSMWNQAMELYEQGKSTGQATGESFVEWVWDTKDSGAAAVSGAAKQIQEAYDASGSKAASVKDWVQEDLASHGTWEYQIISNTDETRATAKLNELGKDRWECFSVVEKGDPGQVFYYLKRRRLSYLRRVPELMPYIPLGVGGGDGAP